MVSGRGLMGFTVAGCEGGFRLGWGSEGGFRVGPDGMDWGVYVEVGRSGAVTAGHRRGTINTNY